MGSLITTLKRSASSFGSDQCSTLAAAIAYNAVFAIFPMAFVGIAVLGFMMGGGSARQQVVDAITKVIPLGTSGSQALSKALQGTHSARGWLSLIAIVTAAWSASGLFGNIRQALDSVWDVDRPLPFLRAKVRDLNLFVVFGGLMLASAASAGFLQGARTAGGGVLGPLLHLAAPLFILLTIAVPMALTFLAFIYLYKVAPHARISWGDVWIASLIATLFFTFGTNLLTFYLVHLGGVNALAGTLGAAILFLVFVYYSSQVLLLAAEISKHRMLVRTGALPATDPKVETPKVPLTQKVKDMLVRLWVVEEPHHEQDLPYHPSRRDPVTNAPTNTKEEVQYNIAESEEQAQREAAKAGKAPMPHAASPMLTYGPEAERSLERTGAGAQSAVASSDSAEAGNGKARFGFASDLQPQPRPLPEHHHEKAPGNNFLWKGMGYLIALVLTAVVRRRERQVEKAKQAQKQQQSRTTRRLILRHRH